MKIIVIVALFSLFILFLVLVARQKETLIQPRKTIAVCFWGLTRSLRHTLPSIEEMILRPLRDQGFECTIFLHTYQLETPYNNKRSGEKDCPLNQDEWRVLRPDHVLVENQDQVDRALDLPKYHSSPDPWKNNYQTLDNHVRALWSLHQVTLLWEKSSSSFDYVLYCRPDVLYLTPLQDSFFKDATEQSIVIPEFHEYPINDRFCIATPTVATLYGKRFSTALAYSKTKPLHSETFLNDTLQSHKITIHKRRIRFQRFRACSTKPQQDTTA